MTLILGMVRPEGVYLSVDQRLTQGLIVRDDAAIKYLTIHYPPLAQEGVAPGPRAALAYTGLARLPDGTDTGDWIRETLRGEAEVFDVSMAHLRDRLNRDFAGLQSALIINFVAVHDEKRYWGGMSNVSSEWEIREEFGYECTEASQPVVIINGSGAMSAAAWEEAAKLDALSREPAGTRESVDYMTLIAEANRAVAAPPNRTVSPQCHVAFVGDPSPGDANLQARFYDAEGSESDAEMRLLLSGVDLTHMMKIFRKAAEESFRTGEGMREDLFDTDEMNRNIVRRD